MADLSKIAQSFKWNDQRGKAALALAEGRTQQQAADLCEVSRRTIVEWLQYPEFAAEVDRLTLMIGIASRAERLRIAQRVARQRVDDETGLITTKADLLDWLKFAQSETDGIKLDLAKILTAVGQTDPPLADS